MTEQGPGRSLKIAILIKRFIRTGGAERYALEVVRRLAVDHEVHVFAHEWVFDGPESIAFHRIPRVCRKPAWVNQLGFSYFCYQATREGFDIVHSFEKVPTFDVMTVQSPCFKSPDLRGQRVGWRMLDAVRMAFSPRKLAWRWLEHRQFADDGRRIIIAVSGYVKRNIQACYPLNESSIRLAYTGVDVPEGVREYTVDERTKLRAEWGLSPQDLVALFVGTEFKRKGLDGLLQGLALVPHLGVKLLVAGGGGGRMERYVQLAKELKLDTTVQFLGLVQRVEQLYPVADVYLLPTLADPCPLAPLEAMAAGVATVMSGAAFNGSAELIRNGEAAFLTDPRDPDEIARVMTALIDRQRRQDMAVRGRDRVRAWSWEKTVADTLSAYYEVIRRKERGASCGV